MKIVAVGRNYSEHAKELNNPVPTEPVIFTKPDSAILRKNDAFFYPSFSKDIHYEVELMFRICTKGKNIQEKFAHKYYDAVGLGVDFTARDLQTIAKEKGLPWTHAKQFDSSAYTSEFIDKNEFKDLNNINFSLQKNGKTVQEGNSSNMIFNIDYVISYVSKFMTLKKGDIIFTGTPAGVGPVKIDDNLKGFIEDKEMFNFNIK